MLIFCSGTVGVQVDRFQLGRSPGTRACVHPRFPLPEALGDTLYLLYETDVDLQQLLV
jgi:hypothetical protein